jgi:hypothetical protein
MAKGEQRGNRETKKPKTQKPKTNAASPSQKGTAGSSAGSKKIAARGIQPGSIRSVISAS